MQAPVAGAATPRLAGEVSRAGGLGSLGASWTEPDVLRERIRSIGRMTDRPFCVNLVLDFEQDERLERPAVEERAPIVSFSFGLRPELIARARAAGTRVLVQLGSADAARAAGDAGADALIVQGVEAGGHIQSVVGSCRCWPRREGRSRCHCLLRAGSGIRRLRVPRSLPALRPSLWAPDSWPAMSPTPTRGTRPDWCRRKPATLR